MAPTAPRMRPQLWSQNKAMVCLQTHQRETARKLMIYCSPLTHHIAAAARCGPEPGRTPNIYTGAAEYAGKNH